MHDERRANPRVGAVTLEHLTGPSRGTVTWLRGSSLDISLDSDGCICVLESRPDDPIDGLIARLHSTKDSYQIVALNECSVWVGGVRVSARELKHLDMIEFGETGPLSRFRLYRENTPVRKVAADILSDGLVYLRVSRRPFYNRIISAFYGTVRQLIHETTLLFRISVMIAIIVFTSLAYYQNQLNVQLQKRIERDASQLEGFAGALIRAQKEALKPGDLNALGRELEQKLSLTAERLAVLEHLSKASARVIATSMSSIIFLQGAYGFQESSSGRMLRHVVNDQGSPLISPFGHPLLSLESDGPIAERQFTGTGFSVGKNGTLLTNRHVALPWEDDANIEALADQGFQPVMIKFIAYEPGETTASKVELLRKSETDDLAILRRLDGPKGGSGLELVDAPPASGDEIIVMGYPAGLRSLLAQTGDAFIKELQKAKDIEFWSVAARLAKNAHIVPFASRGIISQVNPETIAYDAETTFGGSGGPVLDVNGAVVAINTSILPEYGGSNLGIPAAKVRAFLAAD